MEEFIVTVDGPAGSGKSTIAKIVAAKYGLTYLDTGAMYRMIALYALENNVNLEDEKSVEAMLENTKLDIVGNKFFLNGKDVSEEIRTPEDNDSDNPKNIAEIYIIFDFPNNRPHNAKINNKFEIAKIFL